MTARRFTDGQIRQLRPRPWGWFLAWVLVGGSYALSILGAFTIGLFVLPFPVVATVLLCLGRRSIRGAWGLVSGLSLPVFFVAWLNRAGPGNICTTSPTETSCVQEWSPWPFLLVALVLLIGGVALFISRRHRRGVSSL